MNNYIYKLCVGFVLALKVSCTYSQEATTASGGEAGGTGGTVSFSVGQAAYVSQTTNGGRVDPGVEHGYEILVTGIGNPEVNPVKITAYPNPVSDYLILETQKGSEEGWAYQLSDVLGHTLVEANLTDPKIILEFENQAIGTYILNVTKAGKVIQSFTIIKKQSK